MRLLRRSKDTKTSGRVRETVTRTSKALPERSSGSTPAVHKVVSADTRSFGSTRKGEVNVNVAKAALPSYERFESDPSDRLEDSDVFLKPGSVPPTTSNEVTLFVHGWHNVEPGTLSWVFPSLRAALDAVQRMKNAVAWSIVQGNNWDDLGLARDHGAILIEQA
jgi:hypothetical protein